MTQIGIILSESEIRHKATSDGMTHLSTGVAVLFDKKILLVRRAASDSLPGNYEIPGGGVDEGETVLEGAVREVKEETGLIVSKVIATFEGFDYSNSKKPKVRQTNYLVEVHPGEVKLNPAEHDQFVWVNIDNLDELLMTPKMHKCLLDVFKIIN